MRTFPTLSTAGGHSLATLRLPSAQRYSPIAQLLVCPETKRLAIYGSKGRTQAVLPVSTLSWCRGKVYSKAELI